MRLMKRNKCNKIKNFCRFKLTYYRIICKLIYRKNWQISAET